MPHPNKIVLIIDDSPFITARLKSSLDGLSSDATLLQAQCYAEALPILEKSRPDIVLLDINLPDVNGIEVLRRLKKTYPSMVVIMLSNQSEDVYRSACKQLGAAHFIDKSTEFQLVGPILSSFF
jgi:two-component system invasion response regulator UvrY